MSERWKDLDPEAEERARRELQRQEEERVREAREQRRAAERADTAESR